MPPESRISNDVLELARVRIWRFGIPAPIWIEHAGRIRDLIKKHNMEPIAPELLPALDIAAAPMIEPGAKAAPVRPVPRPFPGGLRIAHFHMGAAVYGVDQKVWREFSASVVESVRARLDAARPLGVEQLVELSEATAGLP